MKIIVFWEVMWRNLLDSFNVHCSYMEMEASCTKGTHSLGAATQHTIDRPTQLYAGNHASNIPCSQ
jgi:hypothetical protein